MRLIAITFYCNNSAIVSSSFEQEQGVNKLLSVQTCQNNRQVAYKELCISILKKNGLRVTSTRSIVATTIGMLDSHFTAKSLHQAVESVNSVKFDFATLYRIVQTFESIGLIHSDSNGGYIPCSHLGCDDTVHVIFSCSVCNKKFEDHIEHKLSKQLVGSLLKHSKFLAHSGVMQMKGICIECENL